MYGFMLRLYALIRLAFGAAKVKYPHILRILPEKKILLLKIVR